jgi:hypothetical protein
MADLTLAIRAFCGNEALAKGLADRPHATYPSYGICVVQPKDDGLVL